jgi:hypothetical protein
MLTKIETWKPIVGYEKSYLISNLGNVWSLSRLVGGGGYQRQVKGGRRISSVNYSGKLILTLCNGDNKTCCVDRLVAEAFIPNPKRWRYLKHLDGNQTNCAVSNLVWVRTRAKPPKPRAIRGAARQCPNCGKRAFFEQNLTEDYLCGSCGHRGQLAPRANSQRMARVRSDYLTGGWTYEALAKKYQVAVSTAWNWVQTAKEQQTTRSTTTNPAKPSQP